MPSTCTCKKASLSPLHESFSYLSSTLIIQFAPCSIFPKILTSHASKYIFIPLASTKLKQWEKASALLSKSHKSKWFVIEEKGNDKGRFKNMKSFKLNKKNVNQKQSKSNFGVRIPIFFTFLKFNLFSAYYQSSFRIKKTCSASSLQHEQISFQPHFFAFSDPVLTIKGAIFSITNLFTPTFQILHFASFFLPLTIFLSI